MRFKMSFGELKELMHRLRKIRVSLNSHNIKFSKLANSHHSLYTNDYIKEVQIRFYIIEYKRLISQATPIRYTCYDETKNDSQKSSLTS